MLVRVTKKDMQKARELYSVDDELSSGKCPVSCAIRRTLKKGPKHRVQVLPGGSNALIVGPKAFKAPDEVESFVSVWDDGLDPEDFESEEFSFILDSQD